MPYIKTWESKLKPGDKMPSFDTVLHDGSTLSSKDLKGKKVILFFYNRDGSQTCTVECLNVRDNYKKLTKLGYDVYGVSVDSIRKHQNFIKKHDLPYPLIHDKDNELAKTFDIYGEKKFMGRISDAVHRTTFVIGENGKIEQVIHPVISKEHVEQILEGMES